MKHCYLLPAVIVVALLMVAGVHAGQTVDSGSRDQSDANRADAPGAGPASTEDGRPDDDLSRYADDLPAPPKGAVVNRRGNWVIKNIRYDVGHYRIRPEFHDHLDAVAEVLKRNPELRVEIQGYTDNKGAEAFNQYLSRKRARAVRVYLANQGIDDKRMTSEGYGVANPVASNDTPEGRTQNRRIEIKPYY